MRTELNNRIKKTISFDSVNKNVSELRDHIIHKFRIAVLGSKEDLLSPQLIQPQVLDLTHEAAKELATWCQINLGVNFHREEKEEEEEGKFRARRKRVRAGLAR